MEACRSDLARFNSTILGRPSYWSRQRQICEAIAAGYRHVCVPSGNNIGKSYSLAGIALGLCLTHPGSITIVAAPTAAQLVAVSWANIVKAVQWAEDPDRGLGYPLGGKFQGLNYVVEPDWRIEGWASGSVESKSGRHARDLFVLYDEASGIDPAVMEAGDSLNAKQYIYFGNPLRPEGRFYERCKSGNPDTKVIQVSSLESPDIHEKRSPRGMADATWLADVKWEYGTESAWWKSHVLGLFPDELYEALLSIANLDLAASTPWERNGSPRRMGVDLAKGNDGDESMIVVRDDRGILEAVGSNRWSLEETARQAKRLADKHGVQAGRITYDASGLGTDFANRLADQGLVGARDFMGSRSGGEKFFNLRAAAAWAFRRRIDPNRVMIRDNPDSPDGPKVFVSQPSFSIPKHLRETYSRELQECRCTNVDGGKIQLETKEDLQARIKRSPNFLDACLMSFAYPHA